jgi:RNA polymerase sigma-70 factor (ECF subfamily)
MSTDTLTEDLFAKASTGCADSFTEFSRRIRPAIRNKLLKLSILPSQIDDIIQETLLKVWLSRFSFDPSKGKISSWVVTIAQRTAIDWIRKNCKQSTKFDEYQREKFNVEKSPVDFNENNKIFEKIAKNLNDFTYSYLLLRYIKNLSIKECSKYFEIPEGTIKSRSFHSINRLAKEISLESSHECIDCSHN